MQPLLFLCSNLSATCRRARCDLCQGSDATLLRSLLACSTALVLRPGGCQRSWARAPKMCQLAACKDEMRGSGCLLKIQVKDHRCQKRIRSLQANAGRTLFAFGPSLHSVSCTETTRRPTYTCPKPPLPSFRSTTYSGDPPTDTCNMEHSC